VGNAEPEGVDCKALSSLLSQLPAVQHNGIKSGRLPSPPGTPSPRKNSGLLSKGIVPFIIKLDIVKINAYVLQTLMLIYVWFS
jgi:hypothetical protein